MRKAIVFMLVLCLMACLCACGGLSDDEIKVVRNVSFEEKELTVTLGTNKSTGYVWDYEIYGECIEPSVNRSFKVTGSKGKATGEVSIGFEGKSAGTAVIVFTTPNSWDGTGGGDSYTVNVEVDADGKIVSADGNEGAYVPEQTPDTPPEQTPVTSITIDELAEGTYTGSMSGVEFVNDSETVFTTIMPGDAEVTIEDGQITLLCESITSAYGMLNGVKTPQSPDGSLILSGTLPLQQSDDAITAAGELSSFGNSLLLTHNDMVFESWTLTERKGDGKYACSVHIAMTDGVPVATVTVEVKDTGCTATVPLALKG